MRARNFTPLLLIITGVISVFASCKKSSSGGGNGGGITPPVTGTPVAYWVTKGDKSALVQSQTDPLSLLDVNNVFPLIEVDSSQAFQTVDGFGYTLTGGSAYLINRMDAASKAALLTELFGTGGTNLGISCLRVSIGASDLSASVFSYNDLPAGQTDPTLAAFSLSQDTTDLIPLLKQILTINPNIKVMGSSWSAPVWMKSNTSSIGGNLQPAYYNVYAKYFVKYIQQMQARGIPVHSVTIQNEPQNGTNNPSMLMTAPQQTDFIKNHLGPAFQAAGVSTKIIIWDHNCDDPNYPISVLNDAAAKQYIDGSAFHLYAGDIGAMSTVYNAHPDKNVYFTEQWTSAGGSFNGDLVWHIKNVMVGSMRNRSKITLEWNLASDLSNGPRTPGGCATCQGALTITGSSVIRNVSYYIVAHLSRFVPPGSVRIGSSVAINLPNVAFKTPDGKKVLVVVNEGTTAQGFNITYKGKKAFTSLVAGAVGTYTW